MTRTPAMKLSGVTPRQHVLLDLPQVRNELTRTQRHSVTYCEIMAGIIAELNRMDRNKINQADITDLLERNSHFIFFHSLVHTNPIPLDVAYAFRLKSHLKDRLIVVMKGNRRKLRENDQKILAELERERDFVKGVNFKILKVEHLLQKCLDEMSALQTFALLERAKPRKLDLYFSALRLSAQIHFEMDCLSMLLEDQTHYRYKEILSWIRRSILQGDPKQFKEIKRSGLGLIEEKCAEIVTGIQSMVGKSFAYDLKNTDVTSNWFDLGPNKIRGDRIAQDMEPENKAQTKLRSLSFDKVRRLYDVTMYEDRFQEQLTNSDRQQKGLRLASLYFQIEKNISESVRADGEVQIAIKSELNVGKMTQSEFIKAKLWTNHNSVALKKLHVRVFQMLIEDKKKHPNMYLPAAIEERIRAVESHPAKGTVFEPVKTGHFRDLLTIHQQKLDRPTQDLLNDLLSLHQKIKDEGDSLSQVDFLMEVRRSCRSFEEFEAKLLDFNKDEEQLEDLRLACQNAILSCFRQVKHGHAPPAIIDSAFDVVMDDMLRNLRQLNYSVIGADRYEGLFEMALDMNRGDSAYQLDTLLRELHSIPKQDFLLTALQQARSKLPEEELLEKQSFINQNEVALQILVQKIRSELRERIASNDQTPWSRRNRFEVFGLADFFGPNLRPLLSGLLRTVPRITAKEECEMLIDNIETIEAKVVDAHRATSPNGSAYREIKRLKGSLSSTILDELFDDFEKNRKDLDQTLKEAREGLKIAQNLLKRLGLPDGGGEYLNVAISLDDLSELHRRYHFVPDISVPDIKRFALVYNHKIKLMEDLFAKAKENFPSLPYNIVRLFNDKAFEDFKRDFKIQDLLKVEILYADQLLLEAESQLLIRTLNFVNAHYINDTATIEGLLKILSSGKGANKARRDKIVHIWGHIRRALYAYTPATFSENYGENRDNLLHEAQKLLDEAKIEISP